MSMDRPQSTWSLPPAELLRDLTQRERFEPYIWHPNPIDFAVGRPPINDLQRAILSSLESRLTDENVLGRRVNIPTEDTSIHERPDMVVMFGNGEMNALIDPRELYIKLPEPRPLLLLVNTASKLPTVDFHTARKQLVAAACHNGVIFEGDQDSDSVRKALWVSTQGNFKVIEGTAEEIFDNVVLRILTHYGASFVTERQDDQISQPFTWQDWVSSPIHTQMAKAAELLGDAGIIEDKVNLDRYAGIQHAAFILKALNRSALGESMRSILDFELGVMAITRSGGGKVKLSPNPNDGHLVPVARLTRNGYVVIRPKDGQVVTYPNGSVETFENGLVILASSLVQAGIVHTFPELVNWLDDAFSRSNTVDLIQNGQRPKVLNIDHFHKHVVQANPSIEVVRPDPRVTPIIDHPCGSFEAAMALLSALFQSKIFTTPGTNDMEKVVIASLPGHGSVALGGDRQALTNTILSLDLKPPEVI